MNLELLFILTPIVIIFGLTKITDTLLNQHQRLRDKGKISNQCYKEQP